MLSDLITIQGLGIIMIGQINRCLGQLDRRLDPANRFAIDKAVGATKRFMTLDTIGNAVPKGTGIERSIQSRC